MWLYALISVIFGLLSGVGAAATWLIHYDTRFRMDSLESKVNSINGKFGRWEQSMRDEIRETVATMELDADTGSNSLGQQFEQMMLAQMMSGSFNGLMGVEDATDQQGNSGTGQVEPGRYSWPSPDHSEKEAETETGTETETASSQP